MSVALDRYILTVLKMPSQGIKTELVTRLNNLSSLSGTPMSPLLTKWVQQNFGLSSVAAIQNWSAGKFSPDMLYKWNSKFPSQFEGSVIRTELYDALTGGGVIPITYLLDSYPGASAAYSVRRLSSTYSGAALRVRRQSDNTEQDIGFVGLDLDTTALTSFVGAGAGWVTKWYDQSGNNNHGIQTVGSYQPVLVSSGVINIINGRPCIPFGGPNDTSLNLTINIIHPSSWSNFASMGRSSLGVRISSIAAKTTTAPFCSVIFNDNNLYVQSTTYYGSTSYNLTGLKLISTFFINTNQLYSYVNSINQNIVGVSTPTSGLFEQIGKQYTNGQNGFINEIIFYPSDKSANRAAIDSNIMTYFSIV